MTRMGVTFDQVALAAKDIHQAGQLPTIEKVRARLGGTGSNSTIARHLQAWKEQTNVSPDPSASQILTAATVQAAVQRVCEQLNDETRLKITAIQEEAQTKISSADQLVLAAQTESQEAKHAYAALQTDYHRVCAERELLLLDQKKLQDQWELLHIRYQGLEVRLADYQALAERQLQEVAHAHQRTIHQLEANCQQQTENAKQYLNEFKIAFDEERQRHLQTIAELKTSLDQERQQVKSQQILNEKLKAELSLLQQEKQRLDQRAQEQTARWQTLENRSLVAAELLAKLAAHDVPASMTHLGQQFHGALEGKLADLKDWLKSEYRLQRVKE